MPSFDAAFVLFLFCNIFVECCNCFRRIHLCPLAFWSLGERSRLSQFQDCQWFETLPRIFLFGAKMLKPRLSVSLFRRVELLLSSTNPLTDPGCASPTLSRMGFSCYGWTSHTIRVFREIAAALPVPAWDNREEEPAAVFSARKKFFLDG